MSFKNLVAILISPYMFCDNRNKHQTLNDLISPKYLVTIETNTKHWYILHRSPLQNQSIYETTRKKTHLILPDRLIHRPHFPNTFRSRNVLSKTPYKTIPRKDYVGKGWGGIWAIDFGHLNPKKKSSNILQIIHSTHEVVKISKLIFIHW